MSDNLRIRLEFQRFSDSNLRNSLLSFRKNETKDVKSLQLLIQKRFNLKQNFLLLIDGFVLEQTEPIDVLRDNDLIVIEAKLEVDLTKIKSKTKIKSENKSIFGEKSFPSYISEKNKEIGLKTKTKIKEIDNKISKKRKSKEYVLSESEETFVGFKSHNKSDRNAEIGLKSHKKDIKSEVIESHSKNDSKHSIKEIEKKIIESVPEVTTLRDVQLRQAFKSANTSMKKRPLTHVGGTATTSDTPKPKRKRGTKEAMEPIDRFSPIIILERNQIDIIENHSKSKQTNALIRKQSARKSFPTPSLNKNIKSDNNSTNNSNIEQNIKIYAKKEETKKGIDFENSRPMTSIPRTGDVIGFKILTLSEDGSSQLESSVFKMGSVLNVCEETQMVDILLHDVIKRKNFEKFDKNDEQIFGIHSLKINWKTVLEPKLIQSSSEPELILL